MGKQVSQSFPGVRPRTTRPLERVHSDLCGPIAPTAYDGSRYILTFIDDFTHFTVLFTLPTKDEVFKYYSIYRARVMNRFKSNILHFHCDNGTEFINHNFKEQFNIDGTEFETTIPGTPENNGVAERMNLTILNKARCMMLGSSLPRTFWVEAVGTSVYLINRTPTKGIPDNVVPAELWC